MLAVIILVLARKTPAEHELSGVRPSRDELISVEHSSPSLHEGYEGYSFYR